MSGKSSLVSVVLCTYNGSKFLKDQMDSLIAQTHETIEIIVSDDHSTDGTYELLLDYRKKHPHIRLFRNEENVGYVKNFEMAIQQCKGEYIALCDQDDIWELSKITELVNGIHDDVLIYHDSRFMDETGQIMDKKLSDVVNFYDGDQAEAFLFFNCISSHAVMFKRELLGHLLPFPNGGFHDAWIGYVACNLGSITFVEECLVAYRQHAGSATDILKRKGKAVKLSRANRYRNELNFIRSCKDLSINKRPKVINNLFKHYQERTEKVFNFSLMLFFIRHIHSICFIYKKGLFSKLNFIVKHCKRVNIS